MKAVPLVAPEPIGRLVAFWSFRRPDGLALVPAPTLCDAQVTGEG